MKKIFACIVALALMLACCSFSVSAAGGPTVEKVTRISDKAILIEFSEDIILDEKRPFVGLRYVNDEDKLQFVNGQPLQYYNFEVSVIDGRTLLVDSTEGIASQMLDFKGQYAFYKDFRLKLCIEEMAPDGVDVYESGGVYNIRSRATGKELEAHYTGNKTLEGCYFDIAVDFNYIGNKNTDTDNMDDPNAEKPVEEEVKVDNNTFIKDDAESASDKVVVIREDINATVLYAALGCAVAAVVGVIAIVVILFVKKGKAGR